jgi:hypothetical protein
MTCSWRLPDFQEGAVTNFYSRSQFLILLFSLSNPLLSVAHSTEGREERNQTEWSNSTDKNSDEQDFKSGK